MEGDTAGRRWPLPVPVLRRYVIVGRLMWRSAPGLSLVCLTLAVTQAGATTALLVTSGRLVGSLARAIREGPGSPAATATWWWLGATAVVLVGGPMLGSVSGTASLAVQARYLAVVCDLTMEAGTRPYGVAHLEDPRTAGRFQALAEATRDTLFLDGIGAIWLMIGVRLGGIGAFVVLLTWRWWAPFVAVAGYLVLAKAMAKWSNTLFDELLDTTGKDRRRATYLRSLLMGSPAGKEVRLFDLANWLIERYASTWLAAMTMVWRHRGQGLRKMLWAIGLTLALNAAVFAVLARDVSLGLLSVGSLVTLVQAILSLSAFTDAHFGVGRNTATSAELMRLRADLGLEPLPRRSTAAVRDPSADGCPAGRPASPAASSGSAEVVIRDLTFTYPSRNKPTLSDLSLHVPAGQSLAIVGPNGAGKSTLIKLLCGLYRPDSGVLLIDGRDPGSDEWARRRVAVIFQDFIRYQFPLRDNVGFGCLARASEHAALNRALNDAGGAELLAGLPRGWDTVLSAEYAGGADLSGGQWQRVALARALAALDGGAGVLVLDEPAAALDVKAEAAIFERFLEVTRGVTTVIVTHRLSAVRRAERIVVLGEAGTAGAGIVEDGSHEELMAQGGHYATMFSLQAARFAAAGAPHTESGRP